MFTLRYSFKGLLQLASFWLILVYFSVSPEVFGQKGLESTLLLCPLAGISSDRLAEDYDYLGEEGVQRPSLDVRLGCEVSEGFMPTSPSSPENIRSALLKARQHYDNLEMTALNGVLDDVAKQIESLQNPFLFRELVGSYLLLRTESALIQDDKNEATRMLELYARVLGKDASINAALYTPTLRQIFTEIKKRPRTSSGTLRVRFPKLALTNTRIAVDLKRQPVTVDLKVELSLPKGLHALTMQTEGAVPVFKFLNIEADQVTEIQWYPQAENAAQKRAVWREQYSQLSQVDSQALEQLRRLQPGVNILLLGSNQHMLVTPQRAHLFVPASSKEAWAAQVKKLQEKNTSQPKEEGWELPSSMLLGIGAVAVVTLGVVVYMMNQPPPLEPPPPILGEDTGLVNCCVGE